MRHKKARTYFGEDTAESLCRWLNDPDFAEENPKLIDLVKLSARYHASVPDDKLVVLLERKCNDVFAGFTFTPWVFEIIGAKWDVHWRPRGRPFSGDPDMQAGEVVFDFLQLAQQGLLPRLRQCGYAKCSKWFFARFMHSSFHSVKCRDLAAKADPSRREKRRAYERWYYEEHLSKKAKWRR